MMPAGKVEVLPGGCSNEEGAGIPGEASDPAP
jgi:hypothetical protein